MFLLLHYILLRNYQQNVMLPIYHLITHQLLHNPLTCQQLEVLDL